MRRRLLELIHCPDCQADFAVSTSEVDGDRIVSGTLRCTACGAEYPIIRSVPCFLERARSERDLEAVYAQSFGHQWTTYDWERDVDEHEFYSITALD